MSEKLIILLFVSFDVVGFRKAQTMAFAIDEINRNSNLLPNVTLGYHLYDNCAKLGVGFRAALSLANGREKQFLLDESCLGSPPVLGIVGDSSSTPSIAISRVLGLYRVPMVSSPFTIRKITSRYIFILLNCQINCNNLFNFELKISELKISWERFTELEGYFIIFMNGCGSFAGELLCHLFLPE